MINFLLKLTSKDILLPL